MHVVVVAHGPRSVTENAGVRARALGSSVSSVTVVPSGPLAAAELDTPLPAALPLTRAVGSAGVREVLLALGDAPTLLVHDDASIDADAARALVNAVERGRYAVPGGRCAHPPLTMIAGHAADLAVIPGSLVMPDSTLDAPLEQVVFVDCDTIHQASCSNLLLPDVFDAADPLLVASMIVRDEEDALPDALASLGSVVDRIDVCDTGSRDGTIEVVKRFGGNVEEIRWRDDFAWARNQAIGMCRDAQFALFLDADERLRVDDPVRFRRWLRTWAHEIDSLMIRIDNDRGTDGVPTSLMAPRIARAAAARFSGPIHEVVQVEPSDGRPDGATVTHPGVSIDHIGYRADVVAGRGKHERNIVIARAARRRTPSLKSTIDLARALLDADPASPEAGDLFDEAASLLTADDPAPIHSMVHAARARRALELGDLDRAVTLAHRALDITSNESLALVTLAEALMQAGRPAELVALHRDLAERPAGAPVYVVRRNLVRYHAIVGRALLRVGKSKDGMRNLVRAMTDDAPGCADLVAAAVDEALRDGFEPDAVVPLLVHDVTGQVVGAVASRVAPIVTSSLALAALGLGGTHAPLVVMQLSAALIAGDRSLAIGGLRHAGALDAVTRAKIADLAARKGHPDVAAELVRTSDGVPRTA